jgi:hypothetical protein
LNKNNKFKLKSFKLKKHFLTFILLFIVNFIFSQNIVSGKVVNMLTGNPIEDVLVQNNFSNQIVFTEKDGSFEMLINQKETNLTFKHLTYISKTVNVNSNLNIKLVVELFEKNLRIDEVVLIEKKKRHSEIVLKEEAINNVQAFTAQEVLEQLPGQSVSNFSINSFKNIVFRTAEISTEGIDSESYGNKAFGTAVVVNDIPQSNNENMQSWAPNSSGIFGGAYNQFGVSSETSNSTYSNAGYGFDLRQVATENIEEIEVVQGIPDAKYGDLTSGLVKIKTKAGITSFISSVSFRDGTTQINGSKGLKISDKIGFLNLGVSYLNSQEDPKDVLNEYTRLSLNTDWSFYRKNFKNTLSLSFITSLDDGMQDPDDVTEVYVKNEDKNFVLTNRFNYNFNKKIIDALDVNLSLNYKTQNTFRSQRVNFGGEVVPVGLVSGISEGLYTPVSYLSVREVEGKPINVFADIQLFKKFKTNIDWKHKVTTGITLRYSDNLGAGRISSPETADTNFTLANDSGGTTGFRPFDFSENVQAEIQYASYIQDNITKRWGNKSLNISAGLRWDNQNGYNVLSPRLNSYYKLGDFKIRGGFGIASKAPSLNSTYTGKQYFDNIIGDFRTETYNVAFVQTFVKEPQNLDLKPTRSANSEIGFDYDFELFDVKVTGYYKKMEDGLTNLNVYNNVVGDAYQVIDNNPSPPTIEITGQENYIYQDQRIINGLTSKDYGVEFIITVPKIESINLDFNINGLYAKTINNDVSNIYTQSPLQSETAQVGIFNSSYERISQLFRLGSNINYHIPKVGLFLSFRTEHFLQDRSYVGDDFERYPVAYLDQEYNYFSIPEAQRTNEQLYGHLFRNEINNENDFDVYHNLHLRLSKDFINGFRIDFYANNFLNFKPRYIDDNGDVQFIDTASLSFGMKLNYKF